MALIAAITLAGTAHAQNNNPDSGSYGALGLTTYDWDTVGLDAKLGYNFNRNFGVEAQGMIGLSSESSPVSPAANAATLTSKPDYTIGAFAVARLPLSDQFEVFARGGYHQTQTNIKISNVLGTDYDVTHDGFAVGGGLQFNLGDKTAIRSEYTYLDKSDYHTFSVGYVRKF